MRYRTSFPMVLGVGCGMKPTRQVLALEPTWRHGFANLGLTLTLEKRFDYSHRDADHAYPRSGGLA